MVVGRGEASFGWLYRVPYRWSPSPLQPPLQLVQHQDLHKCVNNSFYLFTFKLVSGLTRQRIQLWLYQHVDIVFGHKLCLGTNWHSEKLAKQIRTTNYFAVGANKTYELGSTRVNKHLERAACSYEFCIILIVASIYTRLLRFEEPS